MTREDQARRIADVAGENIEAAAYSYESLFTTKDLGIG